MKNLRWIPLLALVLAPAAAAGAPQESRAGVVSHVKVLSDRVPDVSSLEAWKRSFLRDGMTPGEKAMAIWKTVSTFQHQDEPPQEFLHREAAVWDPIKIYNVYGYSNCGFATMGVTALSRYAGLEARGVTINRHVVSEVFWDDAWRLLDASLLCYFPKADGKPASVEEIVAAVNEWFAKNPGHKGDDARIRAFQRAENWTGWKKGPELLNRCPTYNEQGWLPAGTHGWYATMQEYDGSAHFLYECGFSQGYQVNLQLRAGERITRHWGHKGLHVNQKEGAAPGCLGMKVGEDFLRYTPAQGDFSNGRVGNGTHEYDMPVRTAEYRGGALAAENLEDGRAAVKDASRPGVLVVRMPSSYVYLGGKLSLRSRGTAAVSFSDNHGLDWKPLAKGTGDQEIDLAPHCFRRYDYRVKVELGGPGAALEALRFSHDIQHSQRPLPALGAGSNAITFEAGPPEGTITIEGSTQPAHKGRQLLYTDFRPAVKGLAEPHLLVQSPAGEVTFPVSTPGDLTRLRFGAHYRARDAKDGWDYAVSFDGGKTFKPAGRASGPTAGSTKYVTFSEVPAGTRGALVRYSGTARNATMIFDFRIDADYLEPRGGFRPVRITYRWEENGQAREHVHVARSPRESYTISFAVKPTLKSIALELAE